MGNILWNSRNLIGTLEFYTFRFAVEENVSGIRREIAHRFSSINTQFIIADANETPNKDSQRDFNSRNFLIKTINHHRARFYVYFYWVFFICIATLNSTHTSTTWTSWNKDDDFFRNVEKKNWPMLVAIVVRMVKPPLFDQLWKTWLIFFSHTIANCLYWIS